MMRTLLVLVFLTSCAKHPVQEVPSWVTSIRSGEERLKLTMGSKVLYRRIAGGSNLSKQTSCELVLFKIEEDIKRESPPNVKVPFTVESIYYDDIHHDCAVTVSTSQNSFDQSSSPAATAEAVERLKALKSKDSVTDDEVAEILSLRTEIAMKYAMTGLSLEEFQTYSKEKVSLIEGTGICNQAFKSNIFSIHGDAQICWENSHVKGFCKNKSAQCWTRSPY